MSPHKTLAALVALLLPLACGDDPPSAPLETNSAVRLELVSGGTDTAVVGSILSSPFVVRRVDAAGQPVAGTVFFEVVTGGGSFTTREAHAGADGVATSYWTLGVRAGEQTAIATLEPSGASPPQGGFLTFRAVATPAEPALLESVGPLVQEFPVGPASASFEVHVRVKDTYGNLVPDVPVRWRPALNGTVLRDSTRTDVNGETSNQWTLQRSSGPLEGAYSLVAELADGFPLTLIAAFGGAGLNATQVTAGGTHSCALDQDGAAWCWGNNQRGALGDGTQIGRHIPVPVESGHRFRHLAAGRDHTCALAEDGSAWCWGFDHAGQLGSGGSLSSSTPRPVVGGHRFTQIGAGSAHTCALDEYGRIYCWGDGRLGQLGNGSAVSRFEPTLVSAQAFSALAVGPAHSCGLTAEGKLFCWGLNASWEVGPAAVDSCGGIRCGLSPAPVDGDWSSVAAGQSRTCALNATGDPGCWGYGVLVLAVPNPRPLDQVALEDTRTCGRTADGTVYCWTYTVTNTYCGYYYYGDCGVSATPNAAVALSGGLRFASIAAGEGHFCGVEAAKSEAWCWGWNLWGQLGDGSAQNSDTPVRVRHPPRP